MSGASVTSNRSQRSMQSHQSSRSKRSLPQAAAAAAVPPSDASLRSTSSRSSRMSASSKASSKRSRPLPPPESGIPPNSPSVASSGASVASTASSSVRSTHSTQSNQSKRSNRSFRSTSTSKTVRSTRGARSASLLSQGLDLLHGPADGTTATRRHARYCANDGRSSATPSSSLRQAIRLFGAALSSYQANEYGNPPEGGTEERIERTLARLHAHRSEALYRLGAHAAAEADARKALECERIAGCKRTLLSALSGNAADTDFERDGRVDPYHSHHPSGNPLLLHPERGPALRAKLLHLLGLSLLRRGLTSEHGARDAFDSCVDVAEKALDDAEEFTLSERRACPSHGEAEALLKEIVAHARWETGRLERLEALTTRWEHDARGRRFGVKDLEEALEIAPRSVSFMEEYVRYLAGRKRWFEVANRCERWAAETAAMEGVFAREGGGMATRENSDGAFLTEGDPFPGVPPLEDLTEDFFGNQDDKDGVPFYLRTLSDVGAKDAAFRLPKQIVPYYLRALRLEERYGAAIRALNALLEFHAHFEKEQEYMKYFVDRTILLKEKDKLERTIKFKEEGDGLFRDGYFERAAGMYGECLVIDREPDSAATAPAATRFGDVHGTQPFAKPAEAGGRLHAVLHSNRAACFSSLGRYDDAIAECTHALDIHNMYMKAMLRRARCYLKVGEEEKAKADFRKWITFANGAVSLPFPPMGQGPACFFDMPANVSREELGKVKKEMEDVGAVSGGGGGGGAGGVRGAVVRGGATVDEDGQDGSHGGGRISLKKRLSKRRSSKKLNGGASMDTNAFPSGGDGSNYARNNNDGKSRSTKAGGIVMGFFRGISDFFESIGFPACMKKDVEEQVVTGNVSDPRSMGSVPPPMPPPPVPLPQRNNLYDASTVRSRSPQGSVRSNTSRSQQSRSQSRRRSSPHSNGPLRSSLKKDPPATPPTLIRHRPPFEHPLDPPLEINADKDYYEVLGLKESASASDIKQAYFKLAKENHPDRNDSQAARTKFDEVKSAYDILGNKEKKKLYDRKRTGGLDP